MPSVNKLFTYSYLLRKQEVTVMYIYVNSHPLHAWCCLEQTLIDDALDQWLTCSFIVFCHNYIKVKDAKSILYLKYQIPSPRNVFGKVFKCPQINMYLVFYLNTSFGVFDPTL